MFRVVKLFFTLLLSLHQTWLIININLFEKKLFGEPGPLKKITGEMRPEPELLEKKGAGSA